VKFLQDTKKFYRRLVFVYYIVKETHMSIKKILAVALLLPTLALAWQPSQPVNVIIGFAPGSGNEISFRKAASIVEQNNPGVRFIVENRQGADAVIAQNQVAAAEPNGQTIGVPSHMSLFVTNDIWQKNVKKFEYNTFTNVVTLGQSPLALVASKRSIVDTPQQFLATVQSSHRNINIAVGGGAHQMAYEYIMLKTGGDRTRIQAVRYGGPSQAVAAVAADDGSVEFGIMPVAIARPLIESGRVKLIGLTGNRVPEKMGTAPLLEHSVPGISVYAGWMVSLPPNTAKNIVDWYQREFARAIRSEEYRVWARDSFVLLPEDQLTPAGVNKYAESLRKNFAPIITELAKGQQ
jgi:tripartite-type tricarboxylate transporter receptor subunit TctC